MKKLVKVVGAIIENNNKEILCALRSMEMAAPYLWEFPGGKIEKGESIGEAIVREIKEELECDIEFIEEFNDYTHEYENIIVNLKTVKCKLVNGDPIPKEHEKLIWIKREYLNTLVWAPADIKAVELLCNEAQL